AASDPVAARHKDTGDYRIVPDRCLNDEPPTGHFMESMLPVLTILNQVQPFVDPLVNCRTQCSWQAHRDKISMGWNLSEKARMKRTCVPVVSLIIHDPDPSSNPCIVLHDTISG